MSTAALLIFAAPGDRTPTMPWNLLGSGKLRHPDRPDLCGGAHNSGVARIRPPARLSTGRRLRSGQPPSQPPASRKAPPQARNRPAISPPGSMASIERGFIRVACSYRFADECGISAWQDYGGNRNAYWRPARKDGSCSCVLQGRSCVPIRPKLFFGLPRTFRAQSLPRPNGKVAGCSSTPRERRDTWSLPHHRRGAALGSVGCP